MAEFSFGGEFVWWPDPALVEQTNLRRFMRRHSFTTLDELIPRSLEDVARFWEAVVADLDNRGELDPATLAAIRATSYTEEQILGDWFPPEPTRQAE